MAAKNNLEQILTDNNITIGELANKSGLTHSLISAVIESKTTVAPSTYSQIVEALNSLLKENKMLEVKAGDVFPNNELKTPLYKVLITNGIKQVDFAKRAGVSTRTVSRAVKGEQINATTAYQLLNTLNMIMEEQHKSKRYEIREILPDYADIAEDESNLAETV